MARRHPKIPLAIRTKIKKARVARLATVDKKCRPHAVPICFVYFSGSFYTAIDRKPKQVSAENLARLRHIRRSPDVSLIIDEYSEDWGRLWYILVRGKASLIPRIVNREHAEAIRQLRAKYPQYAAGMLADEAPVIRIRPERVVSWGKL